MKEEKESMLPMLVFLITLGIGVVMLVRFIFLE
jgi:hypothetical protein